MIKKWKKNEKNSIKIAIFQKMKNCNFPRFFHFFHVVHHFSHLFIMFLPFFIIFYHFSSIPPLEAKMIFKKKWLKMILKKKLEENCNCLFCGKFLHHWKQKWWKMILKKWKKMKKMKKKKKWKKWKKKWKKLEENCNFSFFGKLQFSSFFSFFYHFFSFVYPFFSLFIIFYHFSSIPPLEVKMIKKNEKKSTKIAIFYFSDNFCTTGSKND